MGSALEPTHPLHPGGYINSLQFTIKSWAHVFLENDLFLKSLLYLDIIHIQNSPT